MTRSERPAVREPRPASPAIDTDRWYFRMVGRYPLLDHDEVVALTKTVQFGEDETERIDAQQRVVLANLRWVMTIAREYTHLSDLDLFDLAQEGITGLIRATEKFDASMGCRFSTYATWWIRQAIIRGIQNKGSTIRLSSHAHEALVRIRRTRSELWARLQREPRAEEIAKELDEAPKKVELLLEASQQLDSLDRPAGPDSELPMGDTLECTSTVSPEQSVVHSAIATAIEVALSDLPERERTIVELRFGLGDDQEHTLEELGQRFGVSRERIRQLEKRALAKLGGCSALRGLRDTGPDGC